MAEGFRSVLSLSISASLIALLLFALKPLYQARLPKAWQYYIWLIVLLRLVVPVAIPGANLVGNLFAGQVPASVQQQAPVVTPDVAGIPQDAMLPAVQPGMSRTPDPAQADAAPATATEAARAQGDRLPAFLAELWAYAWVAWIAIALTQFARKVTSYRSFTRFIRAGWRAVDDPAVLDALDDARQRVGLHSTLPLYENPLAVSPMLVGIWRPVIVIPSAALPPESLSLVFCHELTHYRRMDILYKWFAQAVVCLHWFNPVVYWVRREIDRACELSCDDAVLRRVQTEGRTRYGDTLLACIENSGSYGDMVASVTMSEEGKLMKERLHAIARFQKGTVWTRVAALCLTVGLLCGAVFAGAYASAPTQEADRAQPIVTPAPTAAATDAPVDASTTPAPEATDWDYSFRWQDLAEIWTGYDVAELEKKLEELPSWEDIYSDVVGGVEDISGAIADFNWDDWYQENIKQPLDDNFSSYSYNVNGRNVIQRMTYSDGYFITMRYDSNQEKKSQDIEMLADQGKAVLVASAYSAYAQDDDFIKATATAVDAFRAANPSIPTDQTIRIEYAEGPHTEAPETLALQYISDKNLQLLAAVVYSMPPAAYSELVTAAYDSAQEGALAIVLGKVPKTETYDELLLRAYEGKKSGMFQLLLDHSSDEMKQDLLLRAFDEKRSDVAAQLYYSGEIDMDMDAIVEYATQSLDSSLLGIIHDDLSPAQAAQIAEEAYSRDNISAFSIVKDQLDDETRAGFHQRAKDDRKGAFYTVISLD